MPNKKSNVRTNLPPKELELTIAEAEDFVMAINDAIDIAERGDTAEIILVGSTRVATKSGNTDHEIRIYPDKKSQILKLV